MVKAAVVNMQSKSRNKLAALLGDSSLATAPALDIDSSSEGLSRSSASASAPSFSAHTDSLCVEDVQDSFSGTATRARRGRND